MILASDARTENARNPRIVDHRGTGQVQIPMRTGLLDLSNRIGAGVVTCVRASPDAPMPVTITVRALARHLGLSKSAVAAALRGLPSVAAATAARVHEAAEELGYRPNPLVTANMMRIRGARAVHTCGTTLGYLSDIGLQELHALERQTVAKFGIHRQMGYIGAKTRAHELGFNLDLIEYGQSHMTPARLRRLIGSRGIRGFVIAPHTRPKIQLDLRWEEFATVCIGFCVTTPRFDRVGYDHHEAIVDVCNRMWEQGHRRLGLALPADYDARVMHTARAGFLRWQADHDCEALPIVMAEVANTTLLRSWIRRYRHDCIVTYGHDMLAALAEFGAFRSHRVAVATPTLTPGSEHLGGYNMSLKALASSAIDLLAAKLYRNEYGAPVVRQTVLVLGPWHEPVVQP
jgi:LacI family transcriptional regulator